MNAERLLAQFERISEAPDAIARLRRFILDLAVRGKLVEQDPEDEPAAELLAAISSESQQVKGRRKASTHSAGQVSDGPFGVPSSWEWTQLGAIGDWGSGSTPSRGRNDYYGGATSWFKSGELNDNKCLRESDEKITHLALEQCSFRLNSPGDVLIAMYGATIGKLAILGEEAVTNQAVCACTPCWGVDTEYLYLFLLAQRDEFRLASEGGAQPNISKVKIVNTLIPLPPLAEQHRIVAKVDELMALCDQLEAARQQREQGRECLVAATLQRLNQPAEDPASFRKDASFALQVLPSLTSTPAQIKQLRQTILNLAVRGKLVEQDPEDEPAEVLIERILSHPWLKKRAKPQPAFADKGKTVMRIPIPDSWTWTTIESLLPPNETVTYGILKPVWVESGVPTVRVTEMKTGAIDVGRLPRCDQSRADKFQKTTLKEGDLLISKDGTIGKTAFVPAALTGGNITQHVLRLPLSSLLSKEYIRLSIDSPWCQTYMSGETKGVALQGVNVGDFRKMPIPLPPLAEQHRIVAKVDELMALCDQLEQQLSQADQQRRRLLEAVLAEALGGRLPTAQEESNAAIA
jgi:type I restriction enzyme S subunit